MYNFFNSEKKRESSTKKVNTKAEYNPPEKPIRSEFAVHREIMKAVGTKQIINLMLKYNKQLEQSNVDKEKIRRVLIEEHLMLEKMNLPEDEIANELEQKMKQLLPHKR